MAKKYAKNSIKKEALPSFWRVLEKGVGYIYLVLMLGLFPLVYGSKNYINIMETKWTFFMVTTIMAAGAILILVIANLIFDRISFDFIKNIEDIKKRFCLTDIFVLVLGIVVFVSMLCSENIQGAWDGSMGKMAGAFMYLILIIAYFIISRYAKLSGSLLYIYLAANTFVFVLAVLNHFMVDPLNIYENLAVSNYWMFSTTMGNINVLSGYFSVFVPVTMVLYLFSTEKVSQLIYGICMVISFMGVIAANSDAGILGVGAAMIFLLWFSFKDYNKLSKYALMVFLFFIGAAIIGFFDGMHTGVVGDMYDAYVNQTGDMPAVSTLISQHTGIVVKDALETLPSFIANSIFNRIMIAVSILCYAVFKYLYSKQAADRLLKVIRNIIFSILALGFIGAIGVIIYFTGKGINVGVWDTYLRFSDDWGSSRGFTWTRVINVYTQHFTVFQQLFGCGPDLLIGPLHTYYDAEIFERMGAYLVDAHNETLQTLATLGVFGVISYHGFQLSTIVKCVKNWTKEPFLLAVAAGGVAYIVQGMMGSPQTFSTPVMFIMLALGQSILREKKDEETKTE